MLFAGDLLFNGGTPFLLQGSVAGAIEALEEARAAGRGDDRARPRRRSCGPEVIDRVLGYLRFVQRPPRAAGRRG